MLGRALEAATSRGRRLVERAETILARTGRRDAPSGRLEPLLDADGRKPGAGGSSVFQSAIALFKAVVGVGVFALPPAMRECGWVLGSLMLMLLALVSMYAADAMIEAVCELRKRGVGVESDGRIEFQEVTRLAFPRVNGTITLLCVVGQFGSVMSFFAFVIDVVTPLADFLRPAHVCAGMAAVVGPIALLRTTSHPVFQAAMVFGNMSVLAAIATIMACAAGRIEEQGGIAPADELHAADWRGAGLTFGVSLFTFACQMEGAPPPWQRPRAIEQRAETDTHACSRLLGCD